MPRIIYRQTYNEIKRDILDNYAEGDRYRSIKEVATILGVSVQTVQNVFTQLKAEGVVDSKPRVGIIVKKLLDTPNLLKKKKIAVISNNNEGRFHVSFFDGIRAIASKSGIECVFIQNQYEKTNSLGFGEYLMSIDVDGIIALSFYDSALPFYYVMREGRDIVADIILDELPTLPAVQTNNYEHAFEAGTIFANQKCKKVYEIGYYREMSKRFTGLRDALDGSGCDIKYIRLNTLNVIGELSGIIKDSDSETGFFLSDYAATYLFCSLCERDNIFPQNILSYDADADEFRFKDIPPIKTVAPSAYVIGKELAKTLVTKWETGKYPEPLQRKI